MGIISWWYIAARNEVDIFPPIPLSWGSMSAWKPSQAQEFRFEGVRSSKPLYIAPYVLAGLQQSFGLSDTFELSDEVAIPIGRDYDFFQAAGFFYSPFAQLVGGVGEYAMGRFYDGNLLSVGLGPQVKISSHFELEGFYGYNHARFSQRHQQLTTHLARLKALYMLDTKFSVAAFLQYNRLEEVYAGNIRLRYNPGRGMACTSCTTTCGTGTGSGRRRICRFPVSGRWW